MNSGCKILLLSLYGPSLERMQPLNVWFQMRHVIVVVQLNSETMNVPWIIYFLVFESSAQNH